MGIPKALTTQQAGSLPWSFTGGDHFTQPVFKKGIPVDSAEDNEAHEIGKYERNEVTRAFLTDGVFLGDVWNDGADKDSFKVSYNGGTLTIKAGRAIVGKRRVDLGAGINADQDITNATVGAFINGYALPAAGNEHVFYIQIYERAVPGTVYFPPAGTAANRSQYFDMLQDVRYYNSAAPGSPFSPPNTPDMNSQAFLEIGRVDEFGVATDKRTLSYVKSPSIGAAGLVVKGDGTIGIDCTHKSITKAIQDSASTFGSKTDGGHPVIWIKPGVYNMNVEAGQFPLASAVALPANVVLFGCSPERRVVSISPSGSQVATPSSLVTIVCDPGNNFVFSGTPLAFWNVLFTTFASGTGGGILQNASCSFVRCVFTSVAAKSNNWNLNGAYFFECDLNGANFNVSSGTFKMERTRITMQVSAAPNNYYWAISTGTEAIPNVFKDCVLSFTSTDPGSPLTNRAFAQTAGYIIFEDCYIVGGQSDHNNFVFTGGESYFKNCNIIADNAGVATTTINFWVQNTFTLQDCNMKMNTATGGFGFIFTSGCNVKVLGGTYYQKYATAGSQTLFRIHQIANGTDNVSFSGVDMRVESGYPLTIDVSGTAVYNINIDNCTIFSGTNGSNAFYMTGAGTATANIFITSTTMRCNGTGVTMYLQSLGGTPTVNVYILNGVLHTNGTTSVQKDYAVSMTNTTYVGDITGGNLTVNAQNTGDGLNCSNVKIGGTASPSGSALVGEMKMYGGVAAPLGWLMCDGSAISRTTYANLFAVIGIAFGAGNGTTTFNIPDLRGRAPVGAGTGTGLTNRVLGTMFGAETHTLTPNEMPSHAHSTLGSTALGVDPAYTASDAQVPGSTGSAGGDQPHNNMQPSQAVNFIIKT